MCQVASNMDKAVEAMEKAQPVEKVQPTENQTILIVPSYSMRLIIFLSVVAIITIALFPVVVVRLAFVSSQLNPFTVQSGHNATTLAEQHPLLANE